MKQNKNEKHRKNKRGPRYLHTHTHKYIYTCINVDNRHAESTENCLSASNEWSLGRVITERKWLKPRTCAHNKEQQQQLW